MILQTLSVGPKASSAKSTKYFHEPNISRMVPTDYLQDLQKIVDNLDLKQFSEKKLDLKVGMWMTSAVLKIQNKSWSTNPQLQSPSKNPSSSPPG